MQGICSEGIRLQVDQGSGDIGNVSWWNVRYVRMYVNVVCMYVYGFDYTI